MDDPAKAEQAGRWGLCASCAYARPIGTDRDSTFVQCARAKDDPRFRRYPQVPVLWCAGHDAASTSRT